MKKRTKKMHPKLCHNGTIQYHRTKCSKKLSLPNSSVPIWHRFKSNFLLLLPYYYFSLSIRYYLSAQVFFQPTSWIDWIPLLKIRSFCSGNLCLSTIFWSSLYAISPRKVEPSCSFTSYTCRIFINRSQCVLPMTGGGSGFSLSAGAAYAMPNKPLSNRTIARYLKSFLIDSPFFCPQQHTEDNQLQ